MLSGLASPAGEALGGLMLRINSALLAASLLIAPLAPAEAAEVIAYFTGQVQSGTTIGHFTGDSINAFSLDPVDDTATPISGRIFYDPDKAVDFGFGTYGGDGLVDWLNFEITLLGQTYLFGSVGAPDSSLQGGQVAPDLLDLQLQRFDDFGSEAVGIRLEGLTFLGDSSLPTNFTYNNPGGGFGSLDINTAGGSAFAAFSIDWAGTQPPAVPEPAVWLNLILGFGLVGLWLRRRPQRGALAA